MGVLSPVKGWGHRACPGPDLSQVASSQGPREELNSISFPLPAGTKTMEVKEVGGSEACILWPICPVALGKPLPPGLSCFGFLGDRLR